MNDPFETANSGGPRAADENPFAALAPDPSRVPAPPIPRSVHAFAWMAWVATWPLLFAGGLVTTYRVGMAVPDWPTTFDENMLTYDFLNASFGVRVEHVHRLLGAGVGLISIGLAGWFLAFDPRGWAKLLGVSALVGVCAQGLLGGLRVTENSTAMAMVHGCLGQLVFGLMTALVVITSRSWSGEGEIRPDRWRVRLLATATAAIVFGQTCVGAYLRHFLAGLEMHAGSAVLVALAVLTTGHLAFRATPALRGLALAMAGVLAVQVALGLATWWVMQPFDGLPHRVETMQAFLRTGHQANGALLLAAATATALMAWRRLKQAGAWT